MTDLAALIILDGFALRDENYGNAVAQAHTPNFDRYWREFPHNQLQVSGLDVGLPEGQMGNSEVGHINIGAGRVVYQSLTRIDQSIDTGEFFSKEEFLQVIHSVKENRAALHLCGLLSDGGVHSHITHLIALLQLAKREQVKDVFVHVFLDGRDVGPQTAIGYIETLENEMARLGVGKIATVSGRYFAMDRDRRWERVQLAYDAITEGEGTKFYRATDVVHQSYEKGIFDEFVVPSVIMDGDGNPLGKVGKKDAMVCFNFRPDRVIQFTDAFVTENFSSFDRMRPPMPAEQFVSMTNYSDSLTTLVAFKPIELKQTVGEVLSENGKSQLRIAETEKYPHVTYFMNGGREQVFPGERRILIDSPKVATYDLQPEMSAYEVTDSLLGELDKGDLNAIILNFANPDMVGHSGMLEPTKLAVEVVDECLGKIVDKILSLNGVAIITADHGNADEVLDENGDPMTAHTTNPVPVIVTKKDANLRDGGRLADLSPTLLHILNIKQPEEMTGTSLILEK